MLHTVKLLMQCVFHLQRAADEDFMFETHNLILTGTESITVSVAIFDDNEVEGKESFSGVLSAFDTLSSRVTLFPAVATANIIDDDCKYCIQCCEGRKCVIVNVIRCDKALVPLYSCYI